MPKFLEICSPLVTNTLRQGVLRAVHVFTPALQYRLEHGGHLPVMAVRSSLYGYRKMKLYHRVQILGPSTMDPLFDAPLPGTGGRGVAILFTQAALRVWYQDRLPDLTLDTSDNRDPKDILQELLRRYQR